MLPQQPGVVDPLTGQPAAPAAPSPFVPLPVVDPNAQPIQPVAGSEREMTGTAFRPAGAPPGGFPIPTPGGADNAPASAGGPAFPIPTPGHADQPAMIPSTTTESSTTTSGVDKATAAGITSATEQANTAVGAAGQAKIDQDNAGAALDQKQSSAAYGRGVNTYFETAAALKVQDDIIAETSKRLEETAKFKPDRTELFKGDKGALFGLSAAVAAMAGGWLMGQGLTGGKNPYLETVMQIIDDNARDQVETNSRVYQELTRKLGSASAAKAELKARMLGALNDTIEAQSRFDKSTLVQKGAAATMAQVYAEQAKNNLEREKLVGQTVQKTVQRKTQMVANPALSMAAGLDLTDSKVYARLEKVGELEGVLSEAASLSGNGALADSVGFVDEKVDAVKGWFNAKDVPEQRVQNLRARWELVNRANWSSEPNGQAVQERLSAITFPQNDAGIPEFLRRVKEVVNTADPGGRYRIARRAMGERPAAAETGRTPIVR